MALYLLFELLGHGQLYYETIEVFTIAVAAAFGWS